MLLMKILFQFFERKLFPKRFKTRFQQGKFVTMLEEKFGILKNGKQKRRIALHKDLSAFKDNDTDVIHINKSIIEPWFLENKN